MIMCICFIICRAFYKDECAKLVKLFGWDEYIDYQEIYPGSKIFHFVKYVVIISYHTSAVNPRKINMFSACQTSKKHSQLTCFSYRKELDCLFWFVESRHSVRVTRHFDESLQVTVDDGIFFLSRIVAVCAVLWFSLLIVAIKTTSTRYRCSWYR